MSKKIVILIHGGEICGENSEERFDKMYEHFEGDNLLLVNTIKRFSDELINAVLRLKTNFMLHMPFFFSRLRPVALLHNTGDYIYIIHLANRLDRSTVSFFDRMKEYLYTVSSTYDLMVQIGLAHFSCLCHGIEEECTLSGNDTLMCNFLCYLAFSARLATLAYIEGIPDAPKCIALCMSLIIKQIHPRLMSIGGWRQVKRICEGFDSDRSSVERVHFIRCNTVNPAAPNI